MPSHGQENPRLPVIPKAHFGIDQFKYSFSAEVPILTDCDLVLRRNIRGVTTFFL